MVSGQGTGDQGHDQGVADPAHDEAQGLENEKVLEIHITEAGHPQNAQYQISRKDDRPGEKGPGCSRRILLQEIQPARIEEGETVSAVD
jgi:hypothetical protein